MHCLYGDAEIRICEIMLANQLTAFLINIKYDDALVNNCVFMIELLISFIFYIRPYLQNNQKNYYTLCTLIVRCCFVFFGTSRFNKYRLKHISIIMCVSVCEFAMTNIGER